MIDHLDTYRSVCLRECEQILGTLDAHFYKDAVVLIRRRRQRGGRLHITGIGKPAHLATYMASLFSSTETPAYYLHGTEAVHGSCGQLVEGDVVICVSNSGETAEMLVLQGLSTILQGEKQHTPEEYVKRHPGGTLGKLRPDEVPPC